MAKTKKPGAEKAAPGKEIEKKKSGEIVEQDFFKSVESLGYSGFENMDQSMITVPFLKIAQGQTPEAQEDHPAHIKGLRPGMLFNSVSGRVYGKEAEFLMIGIQHVYLRWGEDMGEFHGTYTQAEIDALLASGAIKKDGFSSYSSDQDSSIMDSHTLFLLSAEHPDDGIMVMTFKMTGIKHSKKWITKARALQINGKPAPIFCGVWKIGTRLNTNDEGQSWYLLGDKKSCNITNTGTLLDKQYAHLQKPALDAAGFVKSIQEKVIDYGKSVDGSEAVAADESDFA